MTSMKRSSGRARRSSSTRQRRARLIPLVGTPEGQILDVPGVGVLARSGVEFRAPREEELIPLPEHAELQYLPDRVALGYDRKAGIVELDGYAVAARLPTGYTRTLLPAFVKEPGERVEHLPFFGYTAVFARGEELVCAAVRTEASPTWAPQEYAPHHLDDAVGSLLERLPNNRVLEQLKICALEYGCYNAQNVFLHRWEGAVTVSPACNADCLGCISLQPDDRPPSPQERFRFKPRIQEILEVGRHHLQAERSIFSFGQGCEGEPLLQGDLIAEAVAELSQLQGRGTLHLNTNASLPDKVAKIVEAGLDSMRVSTNSTLARVYEAYYQPKRYRFPALIESIRIARRAGVYVSLNLLMMPGWTDVEEEVDSLVRLINDENVNMVQLRTLNIDPDLYTAHVPRPEGRTLGIPELLRVLTTQCSGLVLGNHSPQVRKGEVPLTTNRAGRAL